MDGYDDLTGDDGETIALPLTGEFTQLLFDAGRGYERQQMEQQDSSDYWGDRILAAGAGANELLWSQRDPEDQS